jgi:muconolactone delta-isomerase
MQVKELLKIMDIEQKRLKELIKQDKWNAENRIAKEFYTYQLYSNKRQYDALEDTTQTILRYVSVEDQPD